MQCYLSRNYKGTDGAGNKAKTDMEQIMDSMGLRNVGLPQSRHKNPVLHFTKTLCSVLWAVCRLRKDDVLVLQYPLKKYYEFVCDMAHRRGARVITLVHDLGSFRRKALTVDRERIRLNHSDVIIALNERMKRWLQAHGCQARLLTLDIWDYLSDTHALPAPEWQAPYTVIYAGALSRRKNAFLYDLGGVARQFTVRLYGRGFDIAQAQGVDRIQQMGFVQSDELIATAQGHFGLVWDGESLDGCVGDMGEYLRYNNPHKTSLYIRCYLPLIVWSQAAMAPFVRRMGVGICVDSLRDIAGRLAAITPEEYAAMRQRVERLSNQLSEGYYFRKALRRAFDALNVEVVPFQDVHGDSFRALNEEWITSFGWEIEPVDRKTIDAPRAEIIDKGGHVFMALYNGETVGCVGMMPRGDDGSEFEVIKLAVIPAVQHHGIGRALMDAVLVKAYQLGIRGLFVESNRRCQAAIALYRHLGFQEVEILHADFARCDIQMRLSLR